MAKHIQSNELASATPFSTTFDVETLTQEKPTRVAIPEAVSVAQAADGAPDYAALGIPATAVPALETARQRLAALGRLETSHVYEYGAVIHEVREAAPDQATFAKWSKKVLNLSRRGAENYVSVHRVLSSYRSRIEDLRLKPSMLYLMARAKPECIETLLAQHEAGRKLAVKDVKAMLRDGDEPTERRAVSSGGVAGLKAQIAEKTACGVAAMMETAVGILKAIHVALEPHRQGKRVPKDATMRPLIHPARLLREQLESMIWLAQPAGKGFQEGIVHTQPLSRDDDWYKLWSVLQDLGGYETWPQSAEIGAWLSGTVVPQLEWLVGDRAQKAAAIVNEMAKAAAAERARAEKKSNMKATATKSARKTKALKPDSMKTLTAAVNTISIGPL